MNILVFGAQGSGKSTHAKYIADKLSVPYIYTGDLFRELEKEDSPRGEEIKNLMVKGILIPDELTLLAIRDYLKRFDISKGVVLDGFPRNLNQAKRSTVRVDLIIYITLPEKIAIERLILRGRYDDTPQAIKQRLKLYKKQTQPVLNYYKSKEVKIVEIDNTPPIEIVGKVIDDLLENETRDRNNG